MKKCILHLFKGFLFSVVLLSNLSAEYLLYKEENVDNLYIHKVTPSKQEHEIAFNILQKYMFPMSMSPENKAREELSPEELNNLCNNEQEFIQGKLSEVGSPVKLIFIPTTFYELTWLYLHIRKMDTLFQQLSNKDEDDSVWHNIRGESIFKLSFVPNPTDFSPEVIANFYKTEATTNIRKVTTFQYYENINLAVNLLSPFYCGFSNSTKLIGRRRIDAEPYLCFFHYAINSEIMCYLLRELSLEHLNNTYVLNQIIESVVDQIARKNQDDYWTNGKGDKFGYFAVWIDHIRNCFYHESERAKVILKEAVRHEIDAQARGHFLLYRGTNAQDKIVKESNPVDGYCRSYLSYGNSLFAGIIFDYTGSVISLLNLQEEISEQEAGRKSKGYALSISKEEYMREESNAKKIFKISPLSTIEGLAAGGEEFHSRTHSSFTDESVFQQYLTDNTHVLI